MSTLTILWVSEAGLGPVLAETLSGRPFAILGSESIVPLFRPALSWLVGWLQRRPQAVALAELDELATRIHDDQAHPFRIGLYAHLEKWMLKRFTPSSLAEKAVAASYVQNRVQALLGIEAIIKKHGVESITLKGFSSDFLSQINTGLCKNIHGRPTFCGTFTVNFIIYILFSLFGATYLITRIFKTSEPIKAVMACDFCDDPHYEMLLNQVLDRPQDGLVVLRTPNEHKIASHRLPAYRQISANEGRVTPSTLLPLLLVVMGHCQRILFKHSTQDPALFYGLCRLGLVRAKMRAFYSRVDAAAFWSRDPYNAEHIIRTEELRRRNIRSLGLMHALPTPAIIMANWRYIDFDVFFTFGSRVSHHYADSWPRQMKVVSAGCFRMEPSRLASMPKIADRPKDIAVYTVPSGDALKMIQFVRLLAQSFPDRKVYLQVKGGFRETPVGQMLRMEGGRDLPNVVDTDEDAYTLMQKSSYGLSNPSTVVVEAIQSGVHSFVFDDPDFQPSSIFREFPGICVTTPDSLVQRIRGLETGTWHYPKEVHGALIETQGPSFFDRVRAEIPLPPRDMELNP